MYKRGLDAEAAGKKKEFIYINCWNKSLDPLSAPELDQLQIEALRLTGPVDIRYVETAQGSEPPTRLRVAELHARGYLEITGFVEWEDAILFAVLVTAKETERQNIRRLASVLRHAEPVKLRKDNFALIVKRQSQLESASDPERVRLLREIGHWYRDMGDHAAARKALEECLALEPRAYYAVKELIPVLKKLRDKKGVIEWLGRLLRLDPHNATVYNDAMDFIRHGPVSSLELATVMDELAAEYQGDELTRANAGFYTAQLLFPEEPIVARERLNEAEKRFRQLVPRGHHVFAAIRELKRSYTERPG